MLEMAVIQWLIPCRRCQESIKTFSLEFDVCWSMSMMMSMSNQQERVIKKETTKELQQQQIAVFAITLLQFSIIFLSQCIFCTYFMMFLSFVWKTTWKPVTFINRQSLFIVLDQAKSYNIMTTNRNQETNR